MKLTDCHTHTEFSMDSEADVIACAERAAELGLAAYAITDHAECNGWLGEEAYSDEEKALLDHFDYAADFEASLSAVDALKKRFAGRLNLLCGVELGQIVLAPDIARKAASDPRLDFVIGSVHQTAGEKDFYWIDYEKLSMDEIYDLLGRYFLEVAELCRSGIPDVVGHLTYCLRYMKQRNDIRPDISRFDDIIAESFSRLIDAGKGIEINSSGLRQGFGATFPDLKYVKLFRDLGGEIVTVGSDSHTVEDIGKGCEEAIAVAREAGFRRIAYFRNRKPVFLNIDL